MTQGRFITFEGGEGAGKSTQVKLLAERLTQAGRRVVTTREPGGSEFAEHVRTLILSAETAPKSALAEALLFFAARADHLSETIRPALAAGSWVLCDRFSDSTRVYQGIAGGLGHAVIDDLERIVLGATVPDLTVLLDLDAKAGLSRANARRINAAQGGFIAVDTYEARTLAFHERLRQGFLDIAKAQPKRIAVVDAALNPGAIADGIWHIVAERLGPL
jgi:dTMP kinase